MSLFSMLHVRLINPENIARGLLELKSIIKEMRGGSSVPQEQKEREEEQQKREMKAKPDESLALEMPDFRLDHRGLM